MAGQSTPGWTVIVESNGKEVGRAKADENGEWIIQPDEKISKGEHSLELSARAPEGDKTVFSAQRLALSLADPQSGQPLVALTEEGKATRVLQMPPPPAPSEVAAATPSASEPDTVRRDRQCRYHRRRFTAGRSKDHCGNGRQNRLRFGGL